MRRLPIPALLFIACHALGPPIQAADLTPAQSPGLSGPPWSQALQLSGVTFTNGEHCVYLFNSATGAVTTLTLGEPPHNGLKLEALENADDPATCRAILNRNGEKAVIRPLDYMAGSTSLLSPAPSPVTVTPESLQTDEKPETIREWKGPRFDLEAAKAAAAARLTQEN